MLQPPEIFQQTCDSLGISLREQDIAQLGRFLQLLLETNEKFNLTAIRDPNEAWMRHVLDSLSLLAFLDGVETVLDVGSGGGLPGMPLAIMLPEVSFTLLEATGKKARFLQDAAKELGQTNVRVVNDRAETAGHDRFLREHFDRVIARAVGPLNVMLEFTIPFAKVGGAVLAMKGSRAETELRDAGDAILKLGGGDVQVYETLPGIEPDAVVIQVTKDFRTRKEYPRRPGVPKQEPL